MKKPIFKVFNDRLLCRDIKYFIKKYNINDDVSIYLSNYLTSYTIKNYKNCKRNVKLYTVNYLECNFDNDKTINIGDLKLFLEELDDWSGDNCHVGHYSDEDGYLDLDLILYDEDNKIFILG